MNLVKKLIGAHVETPPPIHPLAEIVETELKTGPFKEQIESFLSALPERPGIDTVHVTGVTETYAVCQCKNRVKDHENPRFFDAEVNFKIDLKSGVCRVVTPT